MDWLEALVALREQGRPAVVVTVLRARGHAPRDPGAKMVVTADRAWGSVGGGNLEAEGTARARAMLAEGVLQPQVLDLGLTEHTPTVHGRQCCGGQVSLLLEPVPVRACVAVFGAGHVGQELVRILSRLDLRVDVVDSRAAALAQLRGARTSDGPADVRLHHTPAPESVLPDLPEGAHLLVMTHDHAEDLAVCDAALRSPRVGSIGLIGSSAKWARFRRRLGREGHGPEALARIRCPIGLPEVAGKEPAVIAVSVTADLVRRGHTARAVHPAPASGLSGPATSAGDAS